MTKEETLKFIEDKINNYAQKIITSGDKGDDSALGELNVYMALRRVVKGEEQRIQDFGMMDAINDTLKALGIITQGKFYKDFFK